MKKKNQAAPKTNDIKDTANKTGSSRQKNAFFRQWMFFLALSIFYIWVIRLFSNPVFLINDNPAILAAAKNGFLAPFVHFLWSRLLSGLYALSMQTPWYGLGLYTLHAMSISLILSVFYRVTPKISFFCMITLVTLFFWSDMIIRLDYSGASIMIGISAVLLFFMLYQEDRLNIKNFTLLSIIVAFSSLPRINGILAVVAIAAPFLGIFFLISDRKNNRPLKAFSRMAVLFILLVLPGFMIYSADGFYRNNLLPPDESTYNKFNVLRGNFHDFEIAIANTDNPEIYKATGWTYNDYLRLQHWMFFDENIYNTQSFERFYEHAIQPEKTEMGFGEVVSSLFLLLKEYSPFFLLMAAGLILAWGRKVYALRDFILLCMTGAAILGVALALEIFMRFPYRIGYPMLFSAGLLVFLFALTPQNQKQMAFGSGWKNFSLTIVLPITILMAILTHGCMLNNKYKNIRSHHQFNQELTLTINTLLPGAFLISEPLLSSFHFIDPINPPDTKFTRVPLGSYTFSPLFYKTLGEMGLKRGSELAPAMMARDDILVLSRIPWAQLLVNYVYERGLGIPQVEGLAEMDDIGLYRLRK